MRKVLRFLFWGIGMGIAPYSMAMELHPGRYSNETFDELSFFEMLSKNCCHLKDDTKNNNICVIFYLEFKKR